MGQQPIDRCPCCGYRTGCVTCPVCFWTDDGQRESDAADAHSGADAAGGAGSAGGSHRAVAVDDGPNGGMSLSEARLNYLLYGASHRRYADVVRRPRADEMP